MGAPHYDLTGRTFGRLTVVGRAPTPPGRRGRYWLCRCRCERECVCSTELLSRPGHPTRSCGCLAREDHGPLELTGEAQRPPGRLTAVAPAGEDARGNRLWLCRCECGGTRTVTAAGFRGLRWTSCGRCGRRRRKEGGPC